MCGRYMITTSVEATGRLFRGDERPSMKPRDNAGPALVAFSKSVDLCSNANNEAREAQWPSYARPSAFVGRGRRAYQSAYESRRRPRRSSHP